MVGTESELYFYVSKVAKTVPGTERKSWPLPSWGYRLSHSLCDPSTHTASSSDKHVLNYELIKKQCTVIPGYSLASELVKLYTCHILMRKRMFQHLALACALARVRFVALAGPCMSHDTISQKKSFIVRHLSVLALITSSEMN